MQPLDTLTIQLRLVPRSSHPRYYEIGGAFFSGFLPDQPDEQAIDRVTKLVSLLNWEVTNVRSIHRGRMSGALTESAYRLPTKRLPQREPDEPIGRFAPAETFFFGISYSIVFFEPGGEEAIAALQPPPIDAFE